MNYKKLYFTSVKTTEKTSLNFKDIFPTKQSRNLKQADQTGPHICPNMHQNQVLLQRSPSIHTDSIYPYIIIVLFLGSFKTGTIWILNDNFLYTKMILSSLCLNKMYFLYYSYLNYLNPV